MICVSRVKIGRKRYSCRGTFLSKPSGGRAMGSALSNNSARCRKHCFVSTLLVVSIVAVGEVNEGC